MDIAYNLLLHATDINIDKNFYGGAILMTVNNITSAYPTNLQSYSVSANETEVAASNIRSEDSVEKTTLSSNDLGALKAIEDVKRFAQTQKVSMERQKAYLLLEGKCRKIYNNMVSGKLVSTRDRRYLLENKPALFAIAENMGKKKENPIEAEKVIKKYENMREINSASQMYNSQIQLLV